MTNMVLQMTPGSARMLRQTTSTEVHLQRAPCRLRPSLQRTHGRTQRTIVRAAETQDKQAEKKEKLVENFKKGGLDKSTAQKVLDTWKQTGASDEDGLKKLLVRRSAVQALTIVIQTGLDAGAAYGAFSLAGFLGAAESIPLHNIWGFGATFLGSYFGTGVIFDLFTLGALIAASLQFQTDSGAFMAAVKEIAGTSGGNTGLNVVDKAAQARSTLKVLQALSSISKQLQESGQKAGQAGEGGTLGSLSTYLLLQKADEQYGWTPEKEGISNEEAGTIARLFAQYDTNSDDRLDLSELEVLARNLDIELSEEEAKEAFKVLDSDGSRYIELPEFAKLYQDQLKKPDNVLTP